MENHTRKVLLAVVIAVGIGFAVLLGVSFASANQPSAVMNQSLPSQFSAIPQGGFYGQMQGTMPSMGAFQTPGMAPSTMNMMGMMNMMMPSMMGSSMMPSMMNMPMSGMFLVPLAGPSNNSGKPLSIEQAQSIATNFLGRLNNPDLVIGIVKEYSNNFYVAFHEKSTGVYAFEVLIDKLTGAVYAEPGPNIFWNTKYGFFMPNFAGPMSFNQFNPQFTTPPMGPMAGMVSPGMGSMAQGTFGSSMFNMPNTVTSTQNMQDMTMGQMGTMQNAPLTLGMMQVNPFASTIMLITPEQAQQLGQQFLNTYFQGQTAGNVRMFYGYYTIDVLMDGKLHCNLSVNGYTGQVWYKTWHVGFIQQIGT